MHVRSLLARVHKLEQAQESHWLLQCISSIEHFEAEAAAGIEAGVYCPVDMPHIVASIRRWLAELP